MSHLSVLRIFGSPFYVFPKKNAVFNGEQEKETLIRVRIGYKIRFTLPASVSIGYGNIRTHHECVYWTEKNCRKGHRLTSRGLLSDDKR